MGHHCCVPGCNSNSRNSGNGALTFHAFPVDPKERKLWILSVRRADYKKLTVNKHTKVCSKHFRDEDFIQPQYSKRRMLKKGVVPSVFAWTKGNQEPSKCEKKTEPSSNDNGGKVLKEKCKVHTSGESSSNASRTEQFEIKGTDRERSGKGKVEPAASKSSVNTMERKIKVKIAKREAYSSSDTRSDDLIPANTSCVSPTKSDDSEQGSVSDVTATNGNSPNSNSNDTSSRKQESALNFQIGTRLEAKDLGNEIWYPVKVVEVDWDDEEILIHFEKWSQRYDEWIPMDSSRLRPTQNPSPQNDGKNASKVFSVGDRVMAKWSDCRRYPAKVKAVLGNDKYEVLFFDGFTKNIKGIRMSKLEDEANKIEEVGPGTSEKMLPPEVVKPVIKNEVTSEAIGTKQERRERKRKINVVELFHPKKRLRLDPESSSSKSLPEIERRKAEKGNKHKESYSIANDDDNEGEKSYIDTDKNATLQESVQVSEIDETVEERKVDEDAVGRSKKKTGARSRGGAGENPDKPRRGGLRQGETQEKAKSLEVKSYMRKIPRKISPGGQESLSTSSKSRRDSSKGNTEDDDAPRKRRKDFLDDSSKSTSTSNRRVNEREEMLKWEPDGQDSYIVESPDGPRKTTVVPDNNLPSGWSKHTIQRKHGNSAGKWDVFLVNPQGRRFRSRNELRLFFEEKGEPFKEEMFDFCLSGKKRMSRTPDCSIPEGRKICRGAGGRTKSVVGPGGNGGEQQPLPLQQKQQLQPQRRVKTLLPKIRRTSALQSEDDNGKKHIEPPSPPPPYTTTVAPVPANKIQTEVLEGEVLVGGLKIQMENNTFKCPKDGCGKNFRKENLLQMHLKHYHPEYNKFMGSTPNVADLAYARTIGESIDDLMPKSRYTGVGSVGVSGTSYSEKANRFEVARKSKTAVAGVGSGKIGGAGGIGGGRECSPAPEKKKVTTKEKQQSTVTTKKSGKGMVGDGDGRAPADDASGENKEPSEEKPAVVDNRENASSTPVADIATAVTHKEEKKEPQTTIKTLMPVIRSPSHAQEISASERFKSKLPVVEEGEEYIEVIDVGPRQVPSTHTTALKLTPQTSGTTTQGSTILTKSLRTIRRRRLSDFHFEPLHKRRKLASAPKLGMSENVAVVDDGGSCVDVTTPTPAATTAGTFSTGRSATTTYRYSKKKTPIVHLEKLNIVTDSNGRIILSPSVQDQAESKLLETPAEQSPVEHLRKEELINCTCGFMEEDGLMIQCDLCLCWQHGICNNIEKETEVPEKYVCPICLNPYRQRKSKKYLHDQDWLKEGKLPSLSFRSKNESNIREREAILKRSHDLTGSLLQIQQVLHSLRVKVNIAGKSDHPKLYLWAKSWEKEGESSSALQTSVSQTEVVTENEFKPQLENAASCTHNEERPASGSNHVVESKLTEQKGVIPITDHSENGGVENVDTSKPDSITEGNPVIAEQQIQEEIIVVETKTSEVVSSVDAVKDEIVLESKILEENNETETEAVTAENTDSNKIMFSSSMGSSLRNEHHSSSTNDQSNSDTTSLPSNENTETKTDEMHLKIEEGVAGKADLPQAVENVHGHTQEAHPAVEQVKEETSDTAVENLEVQSEKKESCVNEVCPETKLKVTDMCNPSEDVSKHPDPDEGALKSSNEEKPDKTTPRPESHCLLHQALTNGSQAANPLNNGGIGSQLDTSGHPMLQLPICQSELMQFANTMADNLRETEPPRPAAALSVPVSEPPRAPQPEAPIDPVECRLCLLDHIDHFQTQIDTRLTMLEEQVAALESQDPDAAKDEAPDFCPQTKQTIQMLLRDLLTVRRIAALN